jgi:cytochrome c-type biogenesis protein CcmH
MSYRLAVLLGALALAGVAHAVDTEPAFDNPALEARYRALIHEIRCPKCQNESIADSDAPVAGDLRREIHKLLGEGKSDADVKRYLLARYGDFVLYRPRLDPTTYALWGAPILFLLIGSIVFWRVLRVRRNQPIEEGEAT